MDKKTFKVFNKITKESRKVVTSSVSDLLTYLADSRWSVRRLW